MEEITYQSFKVLCQKLGEGGYEDWTLNSIYHANDFYFQSLLLFELSLTQMAEKLAKYSFDLYKERNLD